MANLSKPCWSAIAAVALAVCFAAPAPAVQLKNNGFETGDLTGWGSMGLAGVFTDSIGITPTQGDHMAMLSGNQCGLIFGGQPGPCPVTGGGVALPDPSILQPLAQQYGWGPLTSFTAIGQTITLPHAAVLTFAWDWVTQDSIDFPFINITDLGRSTSTFLALFAPACTQEIDCDRPPYPAPPSQSITRGGPLPFFLCPSALICDTFEGRPPEEIFGDPRGARKLPHPVDSSKLEFPRRADARDSALAAGFPARHAV
jgi:hypothetical protein